MKNNLLTSKTPRGRLSRGPAHLRIIVLAALTVTAGCGPRARVPPLAVALSGVRLAPDTIVHRARSLAPTLYLHPDETFPLLRAVAVHHPTRPLIAYHLLWRDDVHGAWIPFTTPTDQEIVWVEYEADGEPARLATYWHGTIVGTDWRGKGPPAVDVQWGKHGMLPRGTILGDVPWALQPWVYYLFTWAFPDLWLGRLNRKGPLCFCGDYGRYRQFTRAVPLAPLLDATIVAEDPDPALSAIFGERYSRKRPWP